VELLLRQVQEFHPHCIAVVDDAAADRAARELHGMPGAPVLLRGKEGLEELAAMDGSDIVLNAVVGIAGLAATLSAIKSGRDVALANKESLVCAGSLVTDGAARTGAALLPVDSEHSALFQLVRAAGRETVESLVLTASGGPFRGRTAADLKAVTPEEALAHPTWAMGHKISIDSATLANKGLEIIEAHHLFAVAYDRIEVVVHPQSVVHSAVRLRDGALLAHMGVADMRVPIAYALHFPQRVHVDVPALDLFSVGPLDFEPPDVDTFPMIRLARAAGRGGDRMTCAFNAANEEAVRGFLEGRLPFLGIAHVVERVLENSGTGFFGTYAEVAAVDEEARIHARHLI
jgi:1-deoxy-D-xylulose-5-phosphate reductoisomerase